MSDSFNLLHVCKVLKKLSSLILSFTYPKLTLKWQLRKTNVRTARCEVSFNMTMCDMKGRKGYAG